MATADDPPVRLGRWGTPREEEWQKGWIVFANALKLVSRLRRAKSAAEAAEIEALLAGHQAFKDYETPALGIQARAAWLVQNIVRPAEALCREHWDEPDGMPRLRVDVSTPENKVEIPALSVEARQVVLFWYLTLKHGKEVWELARKLEKYGGPADGKSLKNRRMWVADHMWYSGNRPPLKPGPGLAQLYGRIHLFLGEAGTSTDTTPAGRLIRHSLDKLFMYHLPAASWLAVLSSFGEPAIPVPLIVQAVAKVELPPILARLDVEPLPSTIQLLVVYNLATHAEDGGEFFQVPRIVREQVGPRLNDEQRLNALHAALLLVKGAFPKNGHDHREWPASEVMAAHVLAVTADGEDIPRARGEVAALLERLSVYYRARSFVNEAITTARRAVAIASRAFGEESPRITGALGNLAFALVKDGQLPEAEEIYRKTAAIERNNPYGDPVDLAETLNLYGNLLRRMERLKEAEAVQLEALNVLHSDEPPAQYWEITNDLGIALEEQDRLDEALKLYESAANALDGRHGTRAAKRNIAGVAWRLGDLHRAKSILEELDAAETAAEEPDYRIHYNILIDLADIYDELDDPRAEVTVERARDIRRPWVD